MIKKFTALALIICIFSAMLVMPNAYAEQFTLEESQTELLRALKVISADDNMDEIVTRGKFMSMLENVLAYDSEELKVYTSDFKDVYDYDDYYSAISYLYQKGFISGYDDGNFYPNEPIQMDHAVTVLVKILGYSVMMNNEDYTSVGRDIGIYNGITFSTAPNITLSEAAGLIYNMLNTDVPEITYGNDAGISFVENYLSYVLSIYETNGIVSDDGKTSLSGDTQVNPGELLIDNVLVTNQTGKNDLLGRNIEGYYRYIKNTDECCLISAYDKSTEIRIEAQNIVDYSNNTYKYVIDSFDSNVNSVSLKLGFACIYNGIGANSATALTSDMLHPENGEVRLIDNNADNRYDVLFVDSYSIVVADGYNQYDNMLIGNNGEKIDLEREYLTVIDTEGNTADISTLQSKNIVSVYESINGESLKLIISAKTIEGRVEKISEGRITIEGGEYRCLPEIFDEISAGYEGVFYLNHENIVSYMKKQTGAGTFFGYLYNAYSDESGDDTLHINIYTDDNKDRTYSAGDSIKIDGITFKRARYSEAIEKLGMNNIPKNGQIVKIKQNSDGYITSIDTAEKESGESEDSLHLMNGASGSDIVFERMINNFGGKAIADENTKIFLVPNDFSSDDIRVTSVEDLRNETPYNASCYTSVNDALVAEVVVIKMDCTGVDVNHAYYSLEQEPYIVEKVQTAINSDNEECTLLTLTNYTGTVEMYTEGLNTINVNVNDEPTVISKGDIIRYGYDKRGLINDGNIVMVYDSSTDTLTSGLHAGGGYERFHQSIRVRRANIDKVEDNNIRFKYDLYDPSDTSTDIMSFESNCKIFVYDRAQDKLIQGSKADLIVGSEAVFYTRSGRLYMVVVYR